MEGQANHPEKARGHHIANAHAIIERRTSRRLDHADRAADESKLDLAIYLAANADDAAGRPNIAAKNRQKRRFAGAVRPQDGAASSRHNPQRDAGKDRMPPPDNTHILKAYGVGVQKNREKEPNDNRSR